MLAKLLRNILFDSLVLLLDARRLGAVAVKALALIESRLLALLLLSRCGIFVKLHAGIYRIFLFILLWDRVTHDVKRLLVLSSLNAVIFIRAIVTARVLVI